MKRDGSQILRLAPASNVHRTCVDAWIKQIVAEAAPRDMCTAFEDAFGALWCRTHRMLGDVTLLAIAARVFSTSAEQFPWLVAVKIDTNGLCAGELRHQTAQVNPAEFESAICLVLIEFLTIIGNLTADVLTSALHAELARLATAMPQTAAPSASARESSPQDRKKAEL